ncbi:MAG: glycine cleavage system protein GcvH [Dehalococcoidia bacterium]|nr:glycine cleavage system protein GcvH [Dehalococcoidia bacterium]
MHPRELLYSADHVWCKKEPDGNIRLGMTYFYQEQLKRIVYLDLPESGKSLSKGDPIASFESSKIASDLISPLSGTIVESNSELSDKPGLVNNDPYGQGWLLLIKPSQTTELDGMLSSKDYISLILK